MAIKKLRASRDNRKLTCSTYGDYFTLPYVGKLTMQCQSMYYWIRKANHAFNRHMKKKHIFLKGRASMVTTIIDNRLSIFDVQFRREGRAGGAMWSGWVGWRGAYVLLCCCSLWVGGWGGGSMGGLWVGGCGWIDILPR